MSEIHIEREHALGLAGARQLAARWAEAARDKLGMECRYDEGDISDRLSFTRSGVKGELQVMGDRFVINARLGLLVAAFRGRIESEVVRNLDALLAHAEPVKAFDREVARRSGSARRK